MIAPDPAILAAAIKCAEEDLYLQRDIDDPQVNKVRALVAAAKAYQPMREALEDLFSLMDAADSALDRDTYDQSLRDEFDAPDDADYSVCAGTVRKCSAVLAAIEKMRAALNPAGPA